MKINGAVHLLNKFKLFFNRNFFGIYVRVCACLGLRPRQFFTRQNKLRLRYIAYIWIFILLFASFDQNTIKAAHSPNLHSNDIVVAHLNPTLMGGESKQTKDTVKNTSKNDDGDKADRYVTQTVYVENDIIESETNRADLSIKNAASKTEQNNDLVKVARFDFRHGLKEIKFNDYLTTTREKLESELSVITSTNSDNDGSISSANLEEQGNKVGHNNLKLASAAGPVIKSLSSDDIYAEQNNAPDTEDKKDVVFKKTSLPVPPKPKFQDAIETRSKSFKVRSGDTFAKILYKAGIKGQQTQNIIDAVSSKYDPRYLKVGQTIHVEYKTNRSGDAEVSRLSMPLDKIRTLAVSKATPDRFDSYIEELTLEPQLRAKNITIKNSLYGSALEQGLPMKIVDKVLRIYAWDVDFQRDLRKGDRLEVLYEALTGRDGQVVDYGDLKYASLNIKGTSIPVYQFTTDDGRKDYFEPNGHSIRKALMMTPLDGGRISSGFGMRKHPILGYSKMHKGVDFAAPIGTPIYAAGDGVIERMGRYGAYGNYIRIRHNSRLKTAYAHLHGYKKGLRKGHRVKQGDVIGYLGNTGRSTGPHLHYEILVNGRQVKPGSLDLPTGKILAGRELDALKVQIEKHHENYAMHLDNVKYAMAETKVR